jgi:hypothetical protein
MGELSSPEERRLFPHGHFGSATITADARRPDRENENQLPGPKVCVDV